MAVDSYTTDDQFQGTNGNVDISFNSSTGEYEFVGTDGLRNAPVFVDDYRTNTGNPYGIIDGTSGLPTRSAFIRIRRDQTFEGPNGNFIIACSFEDTEAEVTDFVLYLQNDTESIETIEFGGNDQLRIPTAFQGQSFDIPPGGVATCIRRTLVSSDPFGGGTIVSGQWDIFGAPDFAPTEEQIVISVDSTKTISASTNVDVAKVWERGFYTFDGTDTTTSYGWDGTQIGSYTNGNSLAFPRDFPDVTFGESESTATHRQYAYTATSSTIYRINLQTGVDDIQFMQNGPSEADTESITIENGFLYFHGGTLPAQEGDAYLAKYDLTQFQGGGSSQSWDTVNTIALGRDSIDTTAGGVGIYSYNGSIFLDSQFEDTDTLIIKVNPDDLTEIKRTGLISTDLQQCFLDSSLYHFGSYFYGIARSHSTGDQWLFVMDQNLDFLEWAFVGAGDGIESYRSKTALLPGKNGEIYLFDSENVNDTIKVFKYELGQCIIQYNQDGDEFIVGSSPGFSSNEEFTLYGPSGIFVRTADDGTGTAGWTTFPIDSIIDRNTRKKHLSIT